MENQDKKIKLRSGNQIIAEAAIKAGCKFYAGYPITPSTGIFKTMNELLPLNNGLFINTPDESSAISYCIGASLHGFKALTSTSGPGFPLMIELIQYAIMTETPLVLVMVQRLGPSIGTATENSQGDILNVAFSVNGGYTLPIFYPNDIYSCYNLTIKAFSVSEKFRTPVIVLLDKEIATTLVGVDYSKFEEMEKVDRKFVTKNSDDVINWKPSGFKSDNHINEFAAVGGEILATVTGSTHNMNGKLKYNDEESISILNHLEEKISSNLNDFIFYSEDFQKDADTLIISYGITSQAARKALSIARSEGKKISLLIIQSLFPIPTELLISKTKKNKRIIIPEENLTGQYKSLIEKFFVLKKIIGINKIGSMITPHDILKELIWDFYEWINETRLQ